MKMKKSARKESDARALQQLKKKQRRDENDLTGNDDEEPSPMETIDLVQVKSEPIEVKDEPVIVI